MNQKQCPNCESPFNFQNPPKKLKNCDHNLCDACLTTIHRCPIDTKKIQYRRYTHKAFPINHDILDLLQEHDSNQHELVSEEFAKHQKKEDETCLLHSKPIQLVCCDDGSLICANCALFGEHKGHNIRNSNDFMEELTSLTEQVLGVFDQMKEKQQNLNNSVIQEYVEDCFREKRAAEVKVIKNSFQRLIEKIRKAEKSAISKLDAAIKMKKEELMKEISIKQLEGKKNQWYADVEKLGNTTQAVYHLHSVKEATKYLSDRSSEGYIVKRGQYLKLEYDSAQNSIKAKIDTQVNNLQAEFDKKVQNMIEQYCHYGKKVNTPLNQTLVNSNITRDNCFEEDILLQIDAPVCEEKAKKIEDPQQKMEGDKITVKIPQVTITKSIQPMPTPKVNKSAYNSYETKKERARSKSRKKRNASNVDEHSRDILGCLNENKKKKKIEIPEKYRIAFEDLKYDRCQTIDFGGAELGDNILLSLCQFISKSSKVRNLKLIRNKLTDDVIYELLNACFKSKITSLNLSQNGLTERAFELFEKYDLGELRNITLSLNKVNRRNVKERLEEFTRRGITMSI